MNRINKTAGIVSLIAMTAAFSLLSMSSLPKEFRYTWNGINPWNGVEGLAYTIRHYLHTEGFATFLVTAALVLLIWWRLYALFCRVWK